MPLSSIVVQGHYTSIKLFIDLWTRTPRISVRDSVSSGKAEGGTLAVLQSIRACPGSPKLKNLLQRKGGGADASA